MREKRGTKSHPEVVSSFVLFLFFFLATTKWGWLLVERLLGRVWLEEVQGRENGRKGMASASRQLFQGVLLLTWQKEVKHQWEARPIWGKIWWRRRVGNNCWRGVPEYLRRHGSGCTWASRAWARNKDSLPTVRGGKMSVGTDAWVGPCAGERGWQFFLIASTLSVKLNAAKSAANGGGAEGRSPKGKEVQKHLEEQVRKALRNVLSLPTSTKGQREAQTVRNWKWAQSARRDGFTPACTTRWVWTWGRQSWIQQAWGFAKWMGQTERTKGIGGICKGGTAARPHVIQHEQGDFRSLRFH